METLDLLVLLGKGTLILAFILLVATSIVMFFHWLTTWGNR